MTITHEAGRFTGRRRAAPEEHEFRAKGEGMEPEYAVDEMVENLRKQLAKFKGKISGKQKGEEGGLGRAMIDDGGLLDDRGSASPRASSCGTWMWTVPRRPSPTSDLPFLVFRNVDNAELGVIYRRERRRTGPHGSPKTTERPAPKQETP